MTPLEYHLGFVKGLLDLIKIFSPLTKKRHCVFCIVGGMMNNYGFALVEPILMGGVKDTKVFLFPAT